jgi:2-polyprenyl-3-methyl-5-hydroxy-6-metoxy-1,4-benzoquinol methylase
MTESITLRSPHGEICFTDTIDHFENAVLRLLGVTRAEFVGWLAFSEESKAEETTERLAHGFARLRPMPAVERDGAVALGPDALAGELLHPSISESPDFGVARAHDGSIGWLVRHESRGFVREITPPTYEEEYFEGATRAGYGSYTAQASWRLEKAARQLREIREATSLAPARALDVGSGYGFFRAALGEAEIENDGVEISAHARAVARELYQQETLGGVLSDHAASMRGRYDLVTLWDVIEHVPDPNALLLEVASCLRPGGVVALRTPNLDCPEAEIFGPHYHSYKREHLVYFTPASIARVAAAADLDVVRIATSSHLLAGFVGDEAVRGWSQSGRGADITAFLRARA